MDIISSDDEPAPIADEDGGMQPGDASNPGSSFEARPGLLLSKGSSLGTDGLQGSCEAFLEIQDLDEDDSQEIDVQALLEADPEMAARAKQINADLARLANCMEGISIHSESVRETVEDMMGPPEEDLLEPAHAVEDLDVPPSQAELPDFCSGREEISGPLCLQLCNIRCFLGLLQASPIPLQGNFLTKLQRRA